jgi:hypothetical protein
VQLRVALGREEAGEEALEIRVRELPGQEQHRLAAHVQALVRERALHEQGNDVASGARRLCERDDRRVAHLALRVARERREPARVLGVPEAQVPVDTGPTHLPAPVAEPAADGRARARPERNEARHGSAAARGVGERPDQRGRVAIRIDVGHGVLRRAPETTKARRSLHGSPVFLRQSRRRDGRVE